MGLDIKTYGVLLYEPEKTSPSLKILKAVIDDLTCIANLRLTDLLRPELVRLGLAAPDASPYECAAAAARLPADSAARLAIPDDQLFMIDARPYDRLGRVPGILGDLARVHGELAPGGIAVTVLNTACASAAADFVRMAEVLDQFPALQASTWVVTNSLREPMPRPFMARVNERRGGRPGGKAGKALAVVEGLPHIVPIGDSIVMVAKKECLETAQDRLKHLRKWGSRPGGGLPTVKPGA